MRIQTSQNVEIDFEVAGLGDRVLAALLDYFLLFCYLIVVQVAAAEVTGQSIGKKARHLKLARLDGLQPTLGNYVLRWLLRFIDIDLTLGMAAILTVFIGSKGQRLGDLAAGTTVIKIKPRLSLRDTIFARLDEDYTPTFHQVETLEDSDIATAKDVLNTLATERKSHTTYLLGTKMKTALENKMGLQSNLPPVEFLRTVIKDYNYVKGKV